MSFGILIGLGLLFGVGYSSATESYNIKTQYEMDKRAAKREAEKDPWDEKVYMQLPRHPGRPFVSAIEPYDFPEFGGYYEQKNGRYPYIDYPKNHTICESYAGFDIPKIIRQIKLDYPEIDFSNFYKDHDYKCDSWVKVIQDVILDYLKEIYNVEIIGASGLKHTYCSYQGKAIDVSRYHTPEFYDNEAREKYLRFTGDKKHPVIYPRQRLEFGNEFDYYCIITTTPYIIFQLEANKKRKKIKKERQEKYERFVKASSK